MYFGNSVSILANLATLLTAINAFTVWFFKNSRVCGNYTYRKLTAWFSILSYGFQKNLKLLKPGAIVLKPVFSFSDHVHKSLKLISETPIRMAGFAEVRYAPVMFSHPLRRPVSTALISAYHKTGKGTTQTWDKAVGRSVLRYGWMRPFRTASRTRSAVEQSPSLCMILRR
jgi:hypothetical protein